MSGSSSAPERPGPGNSILPVTTTHPEAVAAGPTAVFQAIGMSLEQMGPLRTVQTLSRVNQTEGFDCPGCAWPDPQGHRHLAEFCENGAKAVAEEATTRRITAEFWERNSIAALRERTDYWLGQQGRLTEPVIKRPGESHYSPIGWDEAFDLIGARLGTLDHPDQAVFYTSGRTSNEAAFAYQLLARALGTNNLPDCSNMCHESSGEALGESIGIGKGTVSLEDFDHAELIMVVGQNPGTNHPRMLSALAKAKAHGARIISVNPLPESGLMGFRDPQAPLDWVKQSGQTLTDEFCQIRVGGDLAFFQAIAHLVLAADDRVRATGGPGVLDHDFITNSTTGFAAYRASLAEINWDDVLAATGLDREQIERVATSMIEAKSMIICWAMGLTQHRNSVATIAEAVNILLLGGHFGRPGAGACPVRGHSNVQGDRSMGIFERPSNTLLDALDQHFGIEAPREHGHDVVNSIVAMRDQHIKIFMAMGGNFVRATPDTVVTEKALAQCDFTVHVSTKLNGSHLHPGNTSVILPTLGRTEIDHQRSGDQFVSVEDSMSVVHRSRGRLTPAEPHLRSEVAIITQLGRRLTRGKPASRGGTIDWAAMEANYDTIRDHIAAVIPGCHHYNQRVRERDGFVMPNPPRDDRRFVTPSGKASFVVNPMTWPQVPAGRLLMQTLRSHDQYNTTIYGLNDRYRGIRNERKIVFIHPDDLAERGLRDGDWIDITSEWHDGERVIHEFRAVAYPTARGCVAAYYPEANALVPLDSVAERSNTPTSKSIIVRIERSAGTASASG